MRRTPIPSAPLLGAPPAPPTRPRRASRPGDLVDVLGDPLEPVTPPAPEIARCLCGQPATTELITCGRWECGRY